jgi:ribonuclease HI
LHNNHQIVLHFDGLCEPKNPGGVATYGIVIEINGKKVFEDSGLADAPPWSLMASNNVAEYSALIRGLEWLKREGHCRDNVLVLGDSRLIINQLEGRFKVKAPRLRELYHKAKELIGEFSRLKISWVDRSENAEADLLSRIAYAKYVRANPRN